MRASIKGFKYGLNVLYLVSFMFTISVKAPTYSPCSHSHDCSVASFGTVRRTT